MYKAVDSLQEQFELPTHSLLVIVLIYKPRTGRHIYTTAETSAWHSSESNYRCTFYEYMHWGVTFKKNHKVIEN